jgi:hypothetical protein
MFDEDSYAAHAGKVYSELDEADAVAGFLENDDVGRFMELHGVDKGYDCAIFKYVKAPTSGSIMRAHQITYTDSIPGPEAVVEQFGPGEYEWQLGSRAKKTLEGATGRFIVVKRVFVGSHWESMHRKFQRERDRQERKQRQREMREDAEEARIEGVYGAPSQGLDINGIAALIAAARGTQPAAAPAIDPMTMMIVAKMLDQKPPSQWPQILASMAPALVPVVERIMRPAVAAPNPMNDLTAKFLETAMEVKIDQLKPPESDPWFLPVLESFAESLPTIISTLGQLPAFARGPTAAAVVSTNVPNSKEMIAAIKANPESIAPLVAKWDRTYTPADVDMLLESVGIPRPPSTKPGAPAPAAAPAAAAPGQETAAPAA